MRGEGVAWGAGLGLAGLMVATVAGLPARAEKAGIDSTLYYQGAIGCGGPQLEGEGCHVDVESPLVSVSIDGPDAFAVSAAAFTARAETSIAEQWGSGINVLIDAAASTSDCQLGSFPTPENDQLAFKGPVLSHRDAESLPPIGSIGVFSYQFLLVNCTTPGTVRILVAMNTFNGDGESTGDAWNQTEKIVTVPEPSAAAAALAAGVALAALGRRSP